MYNNWKTDFKKMCSTESGVQPPATNLKKSHVHLIWNTLFIP